jgi:hypothetical protein
MLSHEEKVKLVTALSVDIVAGVDPTRAKMSKLFGGVEANRVLADALLNSSIDMYMSLIRHLGADNDKVAKLKMDIAGAWNMSYKQIVKKFIEDNNLA